MDSHKDKTKEELIIELNALQQKLNVIDLANSNVISNKKLLESDNHYRYLFENNPQPMWIYDIKSLSFLEINDAATHHYGYSREEFLGMTIKDIRPKEDVQALQNSIKLTNKPYSESGEWRHLKKNGDIIFVEIISHALTYKNHKARYVMVNDITLQKKALEDRTEALMLYNALVDQAGDAFFVHDFEGKFIEVNQQACDTLGYSKEELLKLSVTDIETDFDLKSAKKEWVEIELGNKFTLYGHQKRKDGTIFPVEVRFGCSEWKGQKLFLGMARDITERKKAEEILKESHALIKIAGEKAKLGGWNVNIGKNRVYWSDEVAAIHEMPLGYSPQVEEVINFYAPEWRGKIKRAFTNCVRKGIIFDEEMQIISASGKRVWVNTIGEAVKDSKGKIVKVHGAFQDISERKRAEESLRQSEENLAITLNSIGDGVIATDLNGLVVNMNPIAEKLCGWSLIDATGKPLTEVFNIANANTLETVINPVKKVLENGKIVGLANHTVLISKNGTEYQISDSAAPIKNKDGKISGVVLVFSDVTEKYLTAQSLIDNEERLNLFFNQSLTGFFFMMIDEPVVWDEFVDKEKTLDYVFSHQRITKVNQAMLDQYLATEEEFINRTLYDFFAHDLIQGRRVIKDLLDKGSLHDETSELRFNGTQMWVEGDYICLYDSKGRMKGFFGTQHDITNRKNALNELQLSKMELEEYFENDISADYILSVDGYVLSCNNTFLKLFGLAKKPDPGTLNLIDFYKNPEQRKKLVTRLIKERKIENYSTDFVSVNGKEINGLLNAIGIFDENDNLIKVRGYIVDITKQIKAEAATRLNDTALKVISQGVVITDANRLVISSNASFTSITGYRESEIIGHTCKFLQGPQSNPHTVEAINEALKHNSEFDGDILNYRKDGTPFWNELTITPIFNSDGLLTHFIGVTRDITERKQAEEQLRKLSCAVEQSPTSIILTDLQGNIEYANPKTLKVTGYELAELIGKNPRIFSAGEKPKEEYKVLWQNITSGKEWQGEFHNKKKNGELFWELASISPILNKEREVTHYLAVKEDITERKQMLEDLILAKEQAEQSDKLKSAFLANMSHEIRTPMNGILGFTELLKVADLSDEKKQKYINVIQKSGVRLLNIINDIVDISKIEAGLMKADIKPSNIKEKIEYIYTFFKPEVEKKGIRFFVKNSSLEEDLIIETDREKIYAIFTNLIKNAIKFTNKGYIMFGYEKKGKYLEFYVKDTGIGIPKDKQEAIFERFIQADISDKMALQGAGLGLSITKAYVELLGGKIWVESEVENLAVGKAGGATFYFTIPCNASPIKEINTQNDMLSDKSGKQTGNLKILIAEDDEASSIYLSILVEEFSSEILMAKNGVDAVEIYKNNPDIDLILMDIQMPYLNGYEATVQIRQLNKDVVIIAQTAFALSYDRQKVIDAGCNDYIPKPISISALTALIRNYFN
jgi:PAS domain S-box-containing protein